MTKSHVSIEQNACLVCGRTFDTGAILLDRRLKDSLDRTTTTGFGLCDEHQKLYDDGFIALVGCDPERSNPSGGKRVDPGDAYRTGRVAFIKRQAWDHIFDVPLPIGEDGKPCPLVFCPDELIDMLAEKIPHD